MKYYKIYVAASYPRKREAEELAVKLMHAGHKVIAEWLWAEKEGYDRDEHLPVVAVRDCKNILDTDVFVSLIGDKGSNGGRHTELGLALAKGTRCILVGEKRQVFHWHPKIEVYSNVEELLDKL